MSQTPDQDAAIAACNETLRAVGLPTYTQIEEQAAMLGIACLDSIEMGKQLIKKIEGLERRTKHGLPTP